MERTNPTTGVHVSIRGREHKNSAIYVYQRKAIELLKWVFNGLGERKVRQVWVEGSLEIRTPKATLLVAEDGSITFGDVTPYEG